MLRSFCGSVEVDSSKGAFDGSDAAPDVQKGETGSVFRYCSSDAVAAFYHVQASL